MHGLASVTHEERGQRRRGKRWRWRGGGKRCGAVDIVREKEREGKLDVREMTAVKGNGGFTLGKGIFSSDALFLLTPLQLRLSAKTVKIGTSDDFLRASEARSLQIFPRSFRNLNSRDS
jgi:hypothetical protein